MKNSSENFAAKVIEQHLNEQPWINDDGSKDSMFDIGIGDKKFPDYAIECIGVMHEKETETWNLGPAKGPRIWNLKGNWDIQISARTRIKYLRDNIEPILIQLEKHNFLSGDIIFVDSFLKRIEPELFKILKKFQIVSLLMYQRDGNGTVYLSMPGSFGAENIHGQGIIDWINRFLSSKKCKDVIYKLSLSTASKKEVFMHLFPGEQTPYEVISYFFNQNDIKLGLPDLPTPVTGFWLVCFEFCLYWNGFYWKKFEIRTD